MAQPAIQTAFHTGEWAPALNARVDQAKYHSAAALLENFFVDYRGGASSRMGTRYILQAYKSDKAVRLINFQASFTVGYVLEFGDFYIRFYNNGAPVLESGTDISGATNADPCVITDIAHGYTTGDWVFITGVEGMTELNGKHFIVNVIDVDTYSLESLNGDPIDSTAYGAYTLGGVARRVYTLPSPYAAQDLATLKFVQNVNSMILCHSTYPPYVLMFQTSDDWSIAPIIFGATINAPTGLTINSTLSAGSVNYAYVVTAVDASGQESAPSALASLELKTDLRTVAGTNNISWSAVPGAASYNVYKAVPSYIGAIPYGAGFGFIGNCTVTELADSNIGPDFSLTPPVPQNPFLGSGVQYINILSPGTYTAVPSVSLDPSPTGQDATAIAVLGVTAAVPQNPGSGPSTTLGAIGFPADSNKYGGLALRVTAVTSGSTGAIISVDIANRGNLTAGSVPSNPLLFTFGVSANKAIYLTWGVVRVNLTSQGAGYTDPPAVTFSSGDATAEAFLLSTYAGYPGVPGLFQQRLVLAAQGFGPQQFFMSRPGAPYNFDVSNPIQPNDAISGQLVSSQLNTIKALVPMPSGLITLTDRAAWQLNGGGSAEAVTPINVVGNTHSYNGCSDVPPIVANFDILYVQSKGSIVRDLTYNFYTNIFTGTDISVLSSHLFFGYQILEWAWAEEPFKVIWAIRDDGVALSLTFMKEQELIGWCHSVTEGKFRSVCVVVEGVDDFGTVDAPYFVVERVVDGRTVKYIERMHERFFPNGVEDAWCVDSGLQYRGDPASTFSGGEHLAGCTVTGLADGVVIPPFEMPASGSFTLPSPASVVTVGLPYSCNLQTLAIDLGEPTVQGKRKKITAVTVRCKDTLGIKIGSDPSNLVVMKDFQIGNVGSATNERVTNLVTADGRTIIDPKWTVPGQYYIRQDLPLPVSVLGVIPEVVVGDTPTEGRAR